MININPNKPTQGFHLFFTVPARVTLDAVDMGGNKVTLDRYLPPDVAVSRHGIGISPQMAGITGLIAGGFGTLAVSKLIPSLSPPPIGGGLAILAAIAGSIIASKVAADSVSEKLAELKQPLYWNNSLRREESYYTAHPDQKNAQPKLVDPIQVEKVPEKWRDYVQP